MSTLMKLTGRSSLKNACSFYTSICRCSTHLSSSHLQYDKDPGPKFIDPETQNLLQSVTRFSLEKIFRKRPTPGNPTVEFKFMTTEQIEDEINKSLQKAKLLLQMPPIVKIQEENIKTISKDPGLHSFDTCKYVITDITFGVKDSERAIVVRNTDGTLQNADPLVRKRLNQVYFPQPGRKIRTPKMFDAENLKHCLNNFEYEFILDRMCIQFEPFEPEFHSVSSQVYQHINETKKFDNLRSTRHFGPMSFFLAWHKMIDDLVIDMVERDMIRNAVQIICLMYNLNDINYDRNVLKQLETLEIDQDFAKVNKFAIAKGELRNSLEDTVGKSNVDFQIDEIGVDFIEKYCKSHGLKKSKITTSLELYRNQNEEKRRLLEGLQKAHGVS